MRHSRLFNVGPWRTVVVDDYVSAIEMDSTAVGCYAVKISRCGAEEWIYFGGERAKAEVCYDVLVSEWRTVLIMTGDCPSQIKDLYAA